MPEVNIVATVRTEFGKGGARRTRRAGQIPAVLYGHGTDTQHLALPVRDFQHALKTDAGMNVLLSLDVPGGPLLALPKSIQRDPVRREIEHVDLIIVRQGEKVTVDIQVTVVGEVPGAIIDQVATSLSIEAEATRLPQGLEVSVEGRAVGDSIRAADVPLPEGAVLQSDPDAMVVSITAPAAEEVEPEGEGAEIGESASGADEG